MHHFPDVLRAHLCAGLSLGQRVICKHGRVSDDATISVARDVGPPLPRAGVGVASSNVFGLETLEFVLDSQFVGHVVEVLLAVKSGRA